MLETSKAKRATTAASPGTDGDVAGLPLEAAIRRKTAKIGVLGLGYVGLPLIRTFVAAGFPTLGFDVDEDESPEPASRTQLHRAYFFRLDRPLRERGQVCGHGRHGPAGGGRCGSDLRAHAAELEPRSGPDLRGGVGPRNRRSSPARSTGHLGEHHVSRNHAGRGVADPGAKRAEAGEGLLSGLQSRAGRPGQPGFCGGQHSQGGRRVRTDEPGVGRRSFIAKACRRWFP